MKYNSHSERAEMSYFRLNLLSYLRDSHPDKASDLSFVATRGDMASEAYSEAIKSGLNHLEATEIANEALFKGLLFSPFNTIEEILWNEFSEEISPSIVRKKAKELLPECRAVISKYELHDDFAGTTEYQSFYTELTGAILILLENEL